MNKRFVPPSLKQQHWLNQWRESRGGTLFVWPMKYRRCVRETCL